MNRSRLPVLMLALLLLILAPSSATRSSGLTALETDDLRLIYLDPTQTYFSSHVARCFVNSMRFQREFWGYTPTEPVSVMLSDSSDEGNAAASSLPRNAILIETSPLSFAYETITANERMNWLMNHELVHVVNGDQAAGSDRFFRKAFLGKVASNADNPETMAFLYLTSPRFFSPRWLLEGAAVFVETWMAGGRGRAQGSWDEMVFRAKVRDDSRFYDPLGLVSEGMKTDFQISVNAYLYGTRFLSYLAYHHGPDSVIQWLARTEGSKKYYAARFKQVYGVPLKDAWRDWVEWEHGFQQTNLEAIREYPLTPYEDISPSALGSVSRPYYDAETNKIYAAFNYPGVVAHVGAIDVDSGSVERLVDIKGPTLFTVTSLTYDPESKLIYYTTDNPKYRDLMVLDPETRDTRMLLKDVRIGDLAFNRADRSIWGVRHFNGIATLVRIPHPYEEWELIHSWPFGEVIYDLDISHDGRLASFSLGEISGRHSLRVMETESLKAGEVEAITEVDFATSLPSNFVFSRDGEHLYGSSYYTGVSNIFRVDVASGTFEALTNTETGLFRPTPLDDDGELIVFRYTGEGFVPAKMSVKPLEDLNAITFLGRQIVEKYPVVKEWQVGSPMDVSLDPLITRQEEYNAFKRMNIESMHPVVEGYKDSFAYGYRVNISDPLRINQLSITASYSPDGDLLSEERTHAQLKFEHLDFRAGIKYNDADFYDLFGPTKTSRKGYSVGMGYTWDLIDDKPRTLKLTADAAFHGDLERLPDYQNVDATFNELSTAQVSLSYENQRFSLGAVDHEKGIKADAHFVPSYVNGDLIPAFIGNFDYGFALPLKHSSIWLRNSIGFADGEQADPFANFFFGGFGNNRVDRGAVKRYREYYAFPGVELNAIGGRNYAKSMVEWNLPPLYFRRVGSPGFYLSWARASIFAGGLRTDLDDSLLERDVANLGAQVDFRMTMLSRFDLTFSLGYAVARESGNSTDEFIYSLKILN